MFQNWILYFKAQSQLLRGRLLPEGFEKQVPVKLVEASGDGDIPYAYLPPHETAPSHWKGLQKPALLCPPA